MIHTTTAVNDYTGVIDVLTFTSDSIETTTIPILFDALVEGTESFTVNITTTINSVRLEPYQSTTVFIEDDTRKLVHKYSSKVHTQTTLQVLAVTMHTHS